MEWWNSTIWKLEFPLKNIMFLWLTLAGKIPVWDHLSRFMGIGPRICSLCHTAKDSIHHIFINFPYFVEMWNYFFVFLGKYLIYEIRDFEEVIKGQLSNPSTQEVKYLPLLLMWGAWIAHNKKIFQDP